MEHELVSLGWRLETDVGFVGHVGGFWHRDIDGQMQIAFIAQPYHANRNGVAHGGMLMTFTDRALGQVARLKTKATRGATISLTQHFLAPVRVGEFVEIRPDITKVTTHMVFISGTAYVNGDPVISAQGVFRVSYG